MPVQLTKCCCFQSVIVLSSYETETAKSGASTKANEGAPAADCYGDTLTEKHCDYLLISWSCATDGKLNAIQSELSLVNPTHSLHDIILFAKMVREPSRSQLFPPVQKPDRPITNVCTGQPLCEDPWQEPQMAASVCI